MNTSKLFHGYNCYSAAIGEYCTNEKIPGAIELILSQWGFFFDENMLVNGQWYTGASDGPVDIQLKEDLKELCSLQIDEKYPEVGAEEGEVQRVLRDNNQLIILVDFYFLDSVRWEYLSRFGFKRQHNPHFIILEELNEKHAIIRDAYYNFKGQISRDILRKAQRSMTRQGEVNYQYYSFNHTSSRKVNLRETIHYRFSRYINEKKYNDITAFGEKLVSNSEFILGQKELTWAGDGYFCLKSVVDQHRNLHELSLRNEITLPEGLSELENEWTIIIKDLFNFLLTHSVRRTDLLKLSEKILIVSKEEEVYARKVVAKI